MDPPVQKILAMQAEMARFENEISSPMLRPRLPRFTPAAVSLRFIPHALHRPPGGSAYPPPPSLHHMHSGGLIRLRPPMPPRHYQPIASAPPVFGRMPRMPLAPPPTHAPTSAVIEAPPTKYSPNEKSKPTIGIAPAVFQDFDSPQQICAALSAIPPPPPPLTGAPSPQKKAKKDGAKKQQSMGGFSSLVVPSSSKVQAPPKRYVRTAGGEVWKDDTLLEWDPSDYRAFCGDLGNEVSDELLAKAFRKYSSFQKAKVIRDKRTNKTKGYGFVSFKDPQDFIKALREMDGKYVGNRPIKLRKSAWKERNIKTVKKKEKGKKKLGLKL